MHAIATYHEALKAIWDRSGYDRGFISNPFAGDDAARLGLLRTQALLNQSEYAVLPYAIVHVAGSKGKGSTCTMIDAMLRAGGFRTGRFLSPHLHSFRERFVVNDTLISEEDFVRLTRDFIQLAERIENAHPNLGTITAFELNTAMALAWFAGQSCDVAVIEVGMGGELDSTNIVTPTVSVITTLDFEHTAILGSTMAKIAANKAGIIKPGRPVLTAQQPKEALEVISERAAASNAKLSIAGQDWRVEGTNENFTYKSEENTYTGLESPLVGPHQMENAGLAIAAINELRKREPTLCVDESTIRTGIASASLPGRFEQVALPSGQTIIIDGAHTPASASALAVAIQERFPDEKVTFVIGMLTDKQQDGVLTPLLKIRSGWIAVAPNNPRAVPVEELAQAIITLGQEAGVAVSVKEGISLARESNAKIIVITGSFSTAAEARVALDLPEVIDPSIPS